MHHCMTTALQTQVTEQTKATGRGSSSVSRWRLVIFETWHLKIYKDQAGRGQIVGGAWQLGRSLRGGSQSLHTSLSWQPQIFNAPPPSFVFQITPLCTVWDSGKCDYSCPEGQSDVIAHETCTFDPQRPLDESLLPISCVQAAAQWEGEPIRASLRHLTDTNQCRGVIMATDPNIC